MKKVFLMAVIMIFAFVACNSRIKIVAPQTSISAQSADDRGLNNSKYVIDQDDRYASYINLLRQEIKAKEIGIPDHKNKEKMSQNDISIEASYKANFAFNQDFECILCHLKSPSDYDGWIIMILSDEHIADFRYLGNTFEEVPAIYFTDIDGDSLDEIVMNCGTLGAGRTGPYRESAVFKWKDGALQTLYYSTDFSEPVNILDTGFEVLFTDGHKGVMKNTITDSETIFEAPGEFPIYSESGNLFDPIGYIEADKSYQNAVGNRNNFLAFMPVDIDDDGISEIIASEAFFIDYQGTWGIGWDYVALKYDVESANFSVIKSAFLPIDSNVEQEEFELNWYKIN